MEQKKCTTVSEEKDLMRKLVKISSTVLKNNQSVMENLRGRHMVTMTINSINYSKVIPLAKEWKDKINKIGFQFHTPFSKDDPLWLPFGDIRNKIVEEIITLKKAYPDYIANTEKQISLMKGNWGGIDTTPIQCPSWAILSLDHMGRMKQPCCIGSANNKGLKPICEKCGLGCYSILVAQGIKGN